MISVWTFEFDNLRYAVVAVWLAEAVSVCVCCVFYSYCMRTLFCVHLNTDQRIKFLSYCLIVDCDLSEYGCIAVWF